MVICKYYARGVCKFGDYCKFEHPRGRCCLYSKKELLIYISIK